ncbi:ABC transporter G family member 35 [Hibiscus syriacus]|uniref:ABC transporter G family member 35 n=1 Tax=Hibiscus syriacus TaxID=106335 RepID=A0A6A2WY80_HIBSY|nr:ABC transporter G family member 35 [Hibiscus syriacus]
MNAQSLQYLVLKLRTSGDNNHPFDHKVELQWAAIERLPTFKRIRTSLFNQKLINAGEGDELGKKVEAECEAVHGKPQLPTLWSTVTNMFPEAIKKVNRCVSRPNKIKILDYVSGIIKPSRMTLLLGLPGCGKTTLLQTLAGKHDPSLKVSGEISYNGCKLIRETIASSARCQGIGSRADILKELSRREKQHGIIPEPDVDTYMKAISVEGLKRTSPPDRLYIKGLDICADTTVGDAKNRGISGGEMKRLTIGEMMVGPAKAFLMDEILTSLDSSTTFQIVTCLQQLAHTTGATILISLRQPAPETFDLFDEVILTDEGKIVYQGPRNQVHKFFEYCGFKCPPRKGLAVFLQEVLSEKEQAQYWFHRDRPYSYVSLEKFIVACKEFHAGQGLNEELCKSFDETENHKNALSFNIYSLGKWELFKACLAREWFFRKLFIQFLFHQVAISIFRLITAVIRTLSVAAIFCQFTVMATLLLSGFIVPLLSMPSSIKWCFWISPLVYKYRKLSKRISIFKVATGKKGKSPMVSSSNVTLGNQALQKNGLNFDEYFYWISMAALIGIWVLVNVGFSLAPSYLKSPGTRRPRVLSCIERKKDSSNSIRENQLPGSHVKTEVTSMVLPFVPVTLSFENMHYFVDTPKKFRGKVPKKKLHLLQDISGAFRPGVLTGLVGASGAGKTTLMDVLPGRKTRGYIEGDIRVGGYPKVQKCYARVSGYCEQTDIHSPQITIKESVIYSAWLRLPLEVPMHKRLKFVEEVLQMIELDEIKDSLVGIRGVSGISAEQHKRLTIAVELVANTSIIFMDEPTSGLDARAAATAMRVVKSIVNTKRTVVCTIHQPSIDIFEAFDEIILMKGGQIVYSGKLGENSCKLIEYFEGIPGVPKIKENYNAATWMLEVTNPSIEAELGVDFARLYKQSSLYQRNKELVQELKVPAYGSKELCFTTLSTK